MAKEYLDKSGLTYLWGKIKAYVSNATVAKSKKIVDANNGTSDITIEYSSGGITSATWFPAFSGYAIKPMSAENVRKSIGANNPENLTSGYLNIHPENGPILIPFMHNDIAHLLKRGGSAVVTYDGTTQSVNISNVFDGSSSYWIINPTGTTEIVIELTLHKTFTYTNWAYVDFGRVDWRSKSVKIEVINTNYEDDVWTQKYSTATNTLGHVAISILHQPVGAANAGGGFNKIRFTFSNWNSATIFRISQLGVYNYGSMGLRETYMSRGMDDSIYRNITPDSTNVYSLGSYSHKWKEIHGALKGNADTATNATKVNNHTVNSDVPANAKFTDTTYENASTAAYGITKLSTATNSTATNLAATPSAVKTAYDLADTANTKANEAKSGIEGTLLYDHTYSISEGIATFTAHVYCKGQEVTDDYEDSCFSWSYRLDDNNDGIPSVISLGTGKTQAVILASLGYGGHVIGTFTPAA